MTKRQENGKGGNIDTRPNPFRNVVRHSQTRPDLASASDLGPVIDKIISAGCGVILASTRDGGAIVLTVLDGDTRHRTYCASDTELEEALDSLNDYYTAP
jgi:hypothetical protein